MKLFLNTNIKLKIILGFGLAFIAFIGIQYLSNRGIDNLKTSEKEMIKTRLLSKKIGEAHTSITAYQNNIAKFILSGNDKFLIGNEINLNNVKISLQSIKDDNLNLEQNVIVNQLDSFVNAEVLFCQQALITFNKENKKEAIDLINTGKGEELNKAITNTSKQLRQIDESNLALTIQTQDSFGEIVSQMDYVATGFAFIIILLFVFILIKDIDTRIKIENQLRIEKVNAEHSKIMEEQFMANMSHEIRTPLNSIIGFTSILRKTKLDDNQINYLNAIQDSGENLLKIVNDILDFSKIEVGMVSIENVPFNLSELLHSINIMFLINAKNKKVSLDFDISPTLPKTLQGDPHRLTQILMNIISNALKFTNQGSISVKAELQREENGIAFIKFTVKDSGIGIPSDKLSNIFDRFIQAKSDTSRLYGGSGLGLSISRKLIELQGGTIRVDSAEGVGSTFIFVIPYNKLNEPLSITTAQRSKSLLNSNTKILVVEDNSLNQFFMSTLLSNWGVSFDLVENGKLAIEKLKESTYNLILMDIQMPEMNGYETAQFIRQKLNLSLPIIAMTAHVLSGEKEKCISYGMTDYISKPIREDELLDLIEKYIYVNLEKILSKKTLPDTINNRDHFINLDYLNELSNGNPAFVRHMIELFKFSNPIELYHLEEAIQNREFKNIYSLAHKIKSNISFAGLDSLIKDDLDKIEDLALNNGDISLIETIFNKVKDVCSKAIEELADFKNLTHQDN